jgi:hypothetical protein
MTVEAQFNEAQEQYDDEYASEVALADLDGYNEEAEVERAETIAKEYLRSTISLSRALNRLEKVIVPTPENREAFSIVANAINGVIDANLTRARNYLTVTNKLTRLTMSGTSS